MKLQKPKDYLSQIAQQSYKEDQQSIKHQLARLANQQFLMNYIEFSVDPPDTLFKKYIKEDVELTNIFQIKSSINSSLNDSLSDQNGIPAFQKIDYNNLLDREEIYKKQIRKQIDQGLKGKSQSLSKAELRLMASKKIKEENEKQQLSLSRRQKKYQHEETIKSKISFIQSFDNSPRKTEIFEINKKYTNNSQVQQTIEDIFIMLQVLGEKKDDIKARWHFWIAKDKKKAASIHEQWKQNQKNMKELLEVLLEKMTKQYGALEIYDQLKIQKQIIPQIIQKKSNSKNKFQYDSPTKKKGASSFSTTQRTKQKSTSSQQSKKITELNRFSQWFNKILMQDRELDLLSRQNIL